MEAPDFTLPTKNAEGLKVVVLSGFKGESCGGLLFFPFAFTGGCTEETCSVRDDLSSYEELDAQVLGISVDSPFAQEAMALKEGLNFPLVSDFNKNASKAYERSLRRFHRFRRGFEKVGIRGFERRDHHLRLVLRRPQTITRFRSHQGRPALKPGSPVFLCKTLRKSSGSLPVTEKWTYRNGILNEARQGNNLGNALLSTFCFREIKHEQRVPLPSSRYP